MNASSTLIAFPGQGSQQPGMGAEFMTHQLTHQIFQEANEVLGYDIAEKMRAGSEAELRETELTQPAMFIAGYAAFSYFQQHAGQELNELASFVAGHSLGELTALTAAGCFDFATGLKLVKVRAEAMQAASQESDGVMAAIIGIPLNQVESYCHSTGCFVANDNAENQAVISGTNAAVDEASNIAAMEMPKKIMRLEVSGAFHTPMMYNAAEQLQAALESVSPNDPAVPVIMNVTAEPLRQAVEVKPRLTQQVTQRVRWRESMQYAANNGVTQVIELGCGKVLTGLAKRSDERLQGVSLTSPWEIDEYLESQAAAA